MSKLIRNENFPVIVSPPGETLQENLGALGMSQADLADRIGLPKKMINDIIKGRTGITPKMSNELERMLDVPAEFWKNSEQRYREFITQKKSEQIVLKSELMEDQNSCSCHDYLGLKDLRC